MRIECVEIQNYRKLSSVRVDLAPQTTLLVGANNSGKTSALFAMSSFLKNDVSAFRLEDVTLSSWAEIEEIGELARAEGIDEALILSLFDRFRALLPALDVWFELSANESHLVGDLIPTLDWTGPRVGLRIGLEPRNMLDLAADYREAWSRRADLSAVEVPTSRAGDEASQHSTEPTEGASSPDEQSTSAAVVSDRAPQPDKFPVWPGSFVDFLRRRFSRHFVLRHYVLDPDKLTSASDGIATPQESPRPEAEIEARRLSALVRVDEIGAQRGLGSSDSRGSSMGSDTSRLSKQLGDYYARHLDPTTSPDLSDVQALLTVAAAQEEFDKRLAEGFAAAFDEMQHLGYPGVTDPKIRVSSRLSPVDGLTHDSAVSFLVDQVGEAEMPVYLPEGRSGLGYQNLISIVFQLMSFRDGWLGTASAKQSKVSALEPIHLVLVEEPEAHLHVQVQQVFAKKAFDVLRNHPRLKDDDAPTSQLVVSTHSSHIAHELPFADLRYFRRLPAGVHKDVPTAGVVSLSGLFGSEKDTQAFVTRYLRAQHADLFFADAIALVEGPAERMLLPNFIRASYPTLDSSYLTILEIGGSHAHRLRPLIVALRVPTLVITDIDASLEGKSVLVSRGAGQRTSNPTLKDWLAAGEGIDELLATSADEKVVDISGESGVRFAYQVPIGVTLNGRPLEEALPSTFEDALVFDNIPFFKELDGAGLTKKVNNSLNTDESVTAISSSLFEALKEAKKAEFALDVIGSKKFETVRTPEYIAEGLVWLEGKVTKALEEVSSAEA